MLPGLLKHLLAQGEHLQILPGPTVLEQPLFPCLPEASTPASSQSTGEGGISPAMSLVAGVCSPTLLCDGSARTDYWNLHNLNFKLFQFL